jgi:hypothetical protein
MPDHVNTRRPSHCGHNNAHRSRGVFFGDALFIYGRGKRLLALPTSWWDRFPRAKDDKKACRGKRFPTLIAGGEMSPSQMRRGHNHNHRLQPPKRQERGKSARIYGCRRDFRESNSYYNNCYCNGYFAVRRTSKDRGPRFFHDTFQPIDV